MIELSPDDLEFKCSKEFPDREKLLLAAVALETTKFERTNYGEDACYNQRSPVGILMSRLGWDGGSDGRAKSREEAVRMRKIMALENHESILVYRQKLIYMLSGYVVNRLTILDREKKSNREVAEWLRLLAA